MKIRLSGKHLRIRLSIILSSCFLIFLTWMSIEYSVELGLNKNDLNKGLGTMSFVRNSYDTIDRLHRPTKYEPCIDIILNDTQPFIRISKDYEKYAKIFTELKITNREVSYLYHDRRHRGYKIYNPSDLTIGGQKIIDFDLERKKDMLIFPLFVVIDILIFAFLFIAITTYREKLISEDKALIKDRKFLKLVGKWWDE